MKKGAVPSVEQPLMYAMGSLDYRRESMDALYS